MDDYESATPMEPPPRPAFLNRVWMVFVKPGELFRDLVRNPAWFPITLCVAAGTAAIVWFIPFELYEEQMVARGAGSSDIDAMAGILKYLILVGTILFLLVVTLIIAALTYVVFVFMRGDEATYRQHLCVVAHSGIVSLLGTAITVPMQIRSGSLDLQLSLGTFAPFLSDGFAFHFLNSLPLFQLWAIVVTGIGIAAIDPRRRAGPTIAVLMVIQVIVAMGCAGLAMAFTPSF